MSKIIPLFPFFGGTASQYIGLPSCPPVRLPVRPVSFIDIAWRPQSLYDVARLHLTASMDFWWNSTVRQLSVWQKYQTRGPFMGKSWVTHGHKIEWIPKLVKLSFWEKEMFWTKIETMEIFNIFQCTLIHCWDGNEDSLKNWYTPKEYSQKSRRPFRFKKNLKMKIQ